MPNYNSQGGDWKPTENPNVKPPETVDEKRERLQAELDALAPAKAPKTKKVVKKKD